MPAKTLGRKVGLGIGKESVRGTAVAPSLWIPWSSVDAQEKIEMTKLDAAYGTISKSTDGQITKKWSEINVTSPICDKALGLSLLSLFGTDTPAAKVAPNTAVYDHTFTVAETVTHQSITVGIDDSIQDYQYANGVVSEMTIKYETGKILECSQKIIAKKGASGSLTPAYVVENVFRPQDLTIKYASTVAGLGAGTAITARTASLTLRSNAVIDWSLGTVDPTDIYNTSFEVEGEFTCVQDADTLKAIVLAGTKEALSFSLTNTGVTIGSSSNPALVITLAQVVFDDVTRETPLDDLVLATYKFTGTYKLSETSMVTAVLTNLTASY